MSVKEQKKSLRKKMMETIKALDPEYKVRADKAILSNLLSLETYASARTVFCFVGSEHEIDTAPFLRRVLADGKTLSVPLCVGKGIMQARRIISLEELNKGFYGILEPPSDAPLTQPEQIDLAVIPCVSCSHDGARLGHGGGYYDIFFSKHLSIPTVMICREKVICEDIPEEPHDLTFPVVVTENGIFTKYAFRDATTL